MADEIRFSELPVADTPLDGTEIVALVQNGTSKKTKVANLGLSVDSAELAIPDSQSRFLAKGQDGKWHETSGWNLMNSAFSQALTEFMPNIVGSNHQQWEVKDSGALNYPNFSTLPQFKVSGATYGSGDRFMDTGNCFIYILGGGNYIEIDNIYCLGITTQLNGNYSNWILEAPNLEYLTNIQFDNMFYRLIANNLKYLGNAQFSYNTVFDLPSLEKIGNINAWGSFQSMNLPNLREAGRINMYNQAFDILFPSLEVAQELFIPYGSGNFTTLSLPNLKATNRFFFAQNSTLQNVDISSLEYCGDTYISFESCSLTQASVDHILTTFAAMNGSVNGWSYQYATILLNGGQNQPPSAIGQAAIVTLQSRGVGVATN